MWQRAVDSLCRDLRDLYGDRLHEVVLYGSHARGDAREDSDIDILVVLHPLGDYWEEFGRISPIASRLSLEYDLLLSVVPIGWAEYVHSQVPWAINVRREGVVVQ
jgi:uncharacterized protein